MIDEQLGSIPFQENSQNPKELFDTSDIAGKTELTPEQVIICSKMRVLGNHIEKTFGSGLLNDFLDSFLTHQLSKDRQSRKEFVSAMQSENSIQNQSLLDRISLPGQQK